MKKYTVTLVLIVGYYDDNNESPMLIENDYEVTANDESDAVYKAKFELDKTGYSVWDSYASEIK